MLIKRLFFTKIAVAVICMVLLLIVFSQLNLLITSFFDHYMISAAMTALLFAFAFAGHNRLCCSFQGTRAYLVFSAIALYLLLTYLNHPVPSVCMVIAIFVFTAHFIGDPMSACTEVRKAIILHGCNGCLKRKRQLLERLLQGRGPPVPSTCGCVERFPLFPGGRAMQQDLLKP